VILCVCVLCACVQVVGEHVNVWVGGHFLFFHVVGN